MSLPAPPGGAVAPDAVEGLHPGPTPESELIMDLEPDQLVAETFRPLPRAHVGPLGLAGLWLLRLFTIALGLMVIYTFIDRLG